MKSKKKEKPIKVDVPEYTASGIESALQLLEVSDLGSNQIAVDRHPERRAKAAWIAFKERETKLMKEENKGVKLSTVLNL